jgi:hypothetical protein
MGELKNSKKHSDEPQYKDKYARDHSVRPVQLVSFDVLTLTSVKRSPSQERGRARGRRWGSPAAPPLFFFFLKFSRIIVHLKHFLFQCISEDGTFEAGSCYLSSLHHATDSAQLFANISCFMLTEMEFLASWILMTRFQDTAKTSPWALGRS